MGCSGLPWGQKRKRQGVAKDVTEAVKEDGTGGLRVGRDIAAGGQLFGFFGILLALPAAAVLSVIIRFAYNRYLKEHPELDVEPDIAVESELE